MKVKKILALALAGVMTLSMGMVAFAAGTDASATSTVTMKKVYKLEGEGTSPAETFTFNAKAYSVTDAADGITVDNMPEVTVDSVSYTAGEATSTGTVRDVTINLPAYNSVGVYTYKITENDSNNAGVTCFENEITLVVTVTQDTNGKLKVAAVHTESPVDSGNQKGEKTDRFDNKYSAGKLEITKNVTGNMGDQEKFFKFTVTLNGEEGKTYQSIAVAGGSGDATHSNPETITVGTPTEIWLKHGDTITLSNIPYNVTYEVTEDSGEAAGYVSKAEFSDENQKIDTAVDTVTFTNTKTGDVDTGINLDNLPYILLLCIAVFGAAALFFKKRSTLER